MHLNSFSRIQAAAGVGARAGDGLPGGGQGPVPCPEVRAGGEQGGGAGAGLEGDEERGPALRPQRRRLPRPRGQALHRGLAGLAAPSGRARAGFTGAPRPRCNELWRRRRESKCFDHQTAEEAHGLCSAASLPWPLPLGFRRIPSAGTGGGGRPGSTHTAGAPPDQGVSCFLASSLGPAWSRWRRACEGHSQAWSHPEPPPPPRLSHGLGRLLRAGGGQRVHVPVWVQARRQEVR